MTGVLIKRDTETQMVGRQCEQTQGEDGHLQAKSQEEGPGKDPSFAT